MMRSGRLPESLSRAFDGSIRTEKPTDLSMAPHTRYEASCQSVRRWGLPSEKQRSEWSPRMSACLTGTHNTLVRLTSTCGRWKEEASRNGEWKQFVVDG